MPVSQARWWILTIPHAYFSPPYLPPSIQYLRGQLELGRGTGFLHWQLVINCKRPTRLAALKQVFGDQCHAEPTKSAAALDYVWKDDTRVEGTQLELGTQPLQRNSATDWNRVRDMARAGRLDDIEGDVYVRHYSNLKRIASDHMAPIGVEKRVFVFWGATGTGKSRRAWAEATLDAYPKDPRSKFWDGYRNQQNVVFDEFRGGIDIAHMLRWLDRYPTIVEVKGSSVVLSARNIWITSNLPPNDWYPDLDDQTKQALLRRFTEVIHFDRLEAVDRT